MHDHPSGCATDSYPWVYTGGLIPDDNRHVWEEPLDGIAKEFVSSKSNSIVLLMKSNSWTLWIHSWRKPQGEFPTNFISSLFKKTIFNLFELFFRTTVRLVKSELPEDSLGQEAQDGEHDTTSSESESSSESEDDEVWAVDRHWNLTVLTHSIKPNQK